MNNQLLGAFLACAAILMPGCASERGDQTWSVYAGACESAGISRVKAFSPEFKATILSLDPGRVTEEQVRDLLSGNPAPQIINIHGGIFPIKSGMNSFAKFLTGMGYPQASIQNPGDGSYTYGYYDRSDEIAGIVAWYYERDGMRPMIVGHSQGGIQTVRVLHKLAGTSTRRLAVRNPVTGKEEQRYEITDPLTGQLRPVVGSQVSYATAAVAGGLARVLPNQWDMNTRLRDIPDSVEEFTGFRKGLDLFGGDFLGYGPANEYRATGTAKVRNVRLPAASPHWTIPYSDSLLAKPAVRHWIANYEPDAQAEKSFGSDPEIGRKSAQLLWAAEVWHDIKKHWVLELQRLIRGQSTS